jgi:threonine/homoserine/homoserine lactone efflux protein
VLAALLVAFVLSFVASMPIAGPIAVIVVSKGLSGQARVGLFIAIGAAVAEAGYAGLAFLGITAMIERFPLLLPISRLIGCAILLALGVYFVARTPKQRDDEPAPGEPAKGTDPPRRTDLGSAALGFSITAVNPTLIVTWTGAVSAVHAAKLLRVHELDALPFAVGVLAGIISWFALFLVLLGRFKRKLDPSSIERVIKGMGLVLIVAGIGFGARTVLQWHSGP